MSQLRIEVLRGDLVESVHQVSVAVVDSADRLVAWAGDPERVVPWRSAAKPFQALPLLQDGGADRFGFDDEEIALTCASHSSEAGHLAIVDRILGKAGIEERFLACGPHQPLSAVVHEQILRDGVEMTPRWSNCSGKHAGMLALAKHHGWPLEGYHRAGHPVQERILDEVERWTGVDRDRIVFMVDGCLAVCFGLPIRAMALSYARLTSSDDAACRRIVGAFTRHPWVVAGTKRFETEVMTALPGEVIAKVGAEGVYSAALPKLGLGIAVKVEDGAWRAAPLALWAVLRALQAKADGAEASVAALDAMPRFIEPPILNTRGEPVGRFRAAGELRFSDS